MGTERQDEGELLNQQTDDPEPGNSFNSGIN